MLLNPLYFFCQKTIAGEIKLKENYLLIDFPADSAKFRPLFPDAYVLFEVPHLRIDKEFNDRKSGLSSAHYTVRYLGPQSEVWALHLFFSRSGRVLDHVVKLEMGVAAAPPCAISRENLESNAVAAHSLLLKQVQQLSIAIKEVDSLMLAKGDAIAKLLEKILALRRKSKYDSSTKAKDALKTYEKMLQEYNVLYLEYKSISIKFNVLMCDGPADRRTQLVLEGLNFLRANPFVPQVISRAKKDAMVIESEELSLPHVPAQTAIDPRATTILSLEEAAQKHLLVIKEFTPEYAESLFALEQLKFKLEVLGIDIMDDPRASKDLKAKIKILVDSVEHVPTVKQDFALSCLKGDLAKVKQIFSLNPSLVDLDCLKGLLFARRNNFIRNAEGSEELINIIDICEYFYLAAPLYRQFMQLLGKLQFSGISFQGDFFQEHALFVTYMVGDYDYFSMLLRHGIINPADRVYGLTLLNKGWTLLGSICLLSGKSNQIDYINLLLQFGLSINEEPCSSTRSCNGRELLNIFASCVPDASREQQKLFEQQHTVKKKSSKQERLLEEGFSTKLQSRQKHILDIASVEDIPALLNLEYEVDIIAVLRRIYQFFTDFFSFDLATQNLAVTGVEIFPCEASHDDVLEKYTTTEIVAGENKVLYMLILDRPENPSAAEELKKVLVAAKALLAKAKQRLVGLERSTLQLTILSLWKRANEVEDLSSLTIVKDKLLDIGAMTLLILLQPQLTIENIVTLVRAYSKYVEICNQVARKMPSISEQDICCDAEAHIGDQLYKDFLLNKPQAAKLELEAAILRERASVLVAGEDMESGIIYSGKLSPVAQTIMEVVKPNVSPNEDATRPGPPA